MAQRHSQYVRMPNDTYVTPPWVYQALYIVEPWAISAWDCAPVDSDFDYLKDNGAALDIATNPPFRLASEFCRRAVERSLRVAMLLPINFDSAKSRRDLFADNAAFKAKYVLMTRIRWTNLPQVKAGPSQNHAWFVWDRTYTGHPKIGWL